MAENSPWIPSSDLIERVRRTPSGFALTGRYLVMCGLVFGWLEPSDGAKPFSRWLADQCCGRYELVFTGHVLKFAFEDEASPPWRKLTDAQSAIAVDKFLELLGTYLEATNPDAYRAKSPPAVG